MICFLHGYIVLKIKVVNFDILTFVKSSCFFIFFIRGYQGLPTWVTSPLTLEFFYWVVSVSWPRSRVWQVNPIDFFFSISSFNIVFDWKLSFMIYFGLLFNTLSWLHWSRIVFNVLTRVDMTHFFIKSFINFIIQHWA